MTTKTTDTPTLAADLVAALSELRTLGQDGLNPHFKSRYLTLQTLIEGVRPILAKHNLALLQPVTADGASVTVTTLLLHTSGAEFSSALTLTATGAPTPQALGSLISYGRRYGAGSLLGIVSDPDADDDGNAASAPPATDPTYDAWVESLQAQTSNGYDALVAAVNDGTDAHKSRLRANVSLWTELKNAAVKA